MRQLLTHTLVPSLVVAAIALSGCEVSASVGDTAQKANVAGIERQISDSLAQQSGVRPTSVDCPDEMLVEEGKEYECTVVHPQDGPAPVQVIMHADGRVSWHVQPASPASAATS
ncbi:MAG: DUF4333 domain-containing protein [Solirubrobacterales bacterium]